MVSAARVIPQHQGDSLSITSETVQFIIDERFVAVAKGHGNDFDGLHTHPAEGIAENRYPIGGRPRHYRPRKVRRTEPHQQELKAFEEILLTSRGKCVAMADAILRDKEDAEDAVQNAFLSAYLHLRSFEGRSALRTWLTRIVLNAAFMMQRKRRAFAVRPLSETSVSNDDDLMKNIPASQPDPEMVHAERETLQFIDGILGKMKPVLRQALTMTYFDELSGPEACAM